MIAALNDTILRQHAVWYPDVYKYPVAADKAAKLFRRLLRGPNNRFLLARVDGAPAGYLFYEIENRRGDAFHHGVKRLTVHHVSVEPAFQRRGIGQALFDKVRAAAAAGGQSEILLTTMALNTKAHAFFERQGFALDRLHYRLDTTPD